MGEKRYIELAASFAKVGAKRRKRQREIVRMDNWSLFFRGPLTKLHPPSTSKKPKGCMLLLEILQSAFKEGESENRGEYSTIHKHLSVTSLT